MVKDARGNRTSARNKRLAETAATTTAAAKPTGPQSPVGGLSLHEVSQDGNNQTSATVAAASVGARTTTSRVSSSSTLTSIESEKSKNANYKQVLVENGLADQREKEGILMQAVIGTKIFPLFQFINNAKELQYSEGPESEFTIPLILMKEFNKTLGERQGWWTAEKQKWVKTRINKLRNNVMGEVLKKLIGMY